MSDEEQNIVESSDGELLTAEFKDGKLEIVEVASYSKLNKQVDLQEMCSDGPELKYVQVLDAKDTVVDLLNFTLVRNEDGEESYRLVSSSEAEADDSNTETVTCVLSSEDADEQENQEYVMVEGIQDDNDGSLVFLQSAVQEAKVIHHNVKKPELKAAFKTPTSPTEILEKAKALQKAKILMRCTEPRGRSASRGSRGTRLRGARTAGPRRRSELPPPHELLASPNFKLFLYSCKLCRFKCNAIKELTAHKALEHAACGGSGSGTGGARWRGAGRAAAGTLQCARCPFRAATHTQLMKHVQDNHVETISTKVYLDSAEVEAADVLVCGACGFESGARDVFRRHIEDEHGATTC